MCLHVAAALSCQFFVFFFNSQFQVQPGGNLDIHVSAHIMNISGDSIYLLHAIWQEPCDVKNRGSFFFFFLLYLKAKKEAVLLSATLRFSLTLERRGA